MNGWLKPLIGVITALAMGAYGFAYFHGNGVKTELRQEMADRFGAVQQRLDRIDRKLDCALQLPTCR